MASTNQVDPLIQPLLDPDTALIQLLNLQQTARTGYVTNSNYYESVQRPEAIGISVPPEMRKLVANVGYPRIYVDAIAERLQVTGFRLAESPESDEQLWDWWKSNDLDSTIPLGFTDALVQGTAYLTVSAPEPFETANGWDQDVPVIKVESSNNLFAEIHPRTRKVIRAIRVHNGPTYYTKSMPTYATVYLPNQTIYYENFGGWQQVGVVNHNLGVVPIVPLANRWILSDIYGTSQITPELRSVTDAAARILMDLHGAAELMAIPQRVFFGVREDELVEYQVTDPTTGEEQINRRSALETYMGHIIALEDHDAKAFQFAAADLRNFTEALDHLDKKAATYTGLPPQYLSVSSDNPASAEAIKASEARLVRLCEMKQRVFGGALEEAMRLGYLVMGQAVPSDALRMETIWADASTPTYAAKADAATKLYAAGTGVIPLERARIDMGYSEEERREMRVWDQDQQFGGLTALYNDGKLVPTGGMDPNATGGGENPNSAHGTHDRGGGFA